MSGVELDPDGTDSYHPQHPWEQTSHHRYLAPAWRSKENWPPVNCQPVGPYERSVWEALPDRVNLTDEIPWFGPNHRPRRPRQASASADPATAVAPPQP
jgi:hypothetical protein